MLDVFLFFFLLQYILFFGDGFIGGFFKVFLDGLSGVFSYVVFMPISYVISFFSFVLLLVFCFGGYFSYSFCICGILEFTLFYSLVAWFTTVLVLFSGVKISVYLRKFGDLFLKTLSMLAVEVVSEISRPLALTVRLTVNIMVGHLLIGFIYIGVEGVLGEDFVWLTVLAIMMECFVFFIQSYIFSRLVYLYLSE